jgi:hypothetical protein
MRAAPTRRARLRCSHTTSSTARSTTSGTNHGSFRRTRPAGSTTTAQFGSAPNVKRLAPSSPSIQTSTSRPLSSIVRLARRARSACVRGCSMCAKPSWPACGSRW